jgi:hypothetical protein
MNLDLVKIKNLLKGNYTISFNILKYSKNEKKTLHYPIKSEAHLFYLDIEKKYETIKELIKNYSEILYIPYIDNELKIFYQKKFNQNDSNYNFFKGRITIKKKNDEIVQFEEHNNFVEYNYFYFDDEKNEDNFQNNENNKNNENKEKGINDNEEIYLKIKKEEIVKNLYISDEEYQKKYKNYYGFYFFFNKREY